MMEKWYRHGGKGSLRPATCGLILFCNNNTSFCLISPDGLLSKASFRHHTTCEEMNSFLNVFILV